MKVMKVRINEMDNSTKFFVGCSDIVICDEITPFFGWKDERKFIVIYDGLSNAFLLDLESLMILVVKDENEELVKFRFDHHIPETITEYNGNLLKIKRIIRKSNYSSLVLENDRVTVND